MIIKQKMEEFEENQIKSKNNKESELGEVITGGFPDDFGNGLETFQETLGKGELHNDDFDDFADFTESSDAFETSGNFTEYNPNNNFGGQISNVSIEANLPQVELSAMDNQTLIESLSDVLDKVFRSNDNISSTNKKEKDSDDYTGLEAILDTPGSLGIWRRISRETTENPFQWKKSKIRKKFYASLGITIDTVEEVKALADTKNTTMVLTQSPQPLRPASKSATCSSAPVSRSTTPSSNNNLSSFSHGNLSKMNNASHSETPKHIDVELAKSLCSISKETLQKYTTTQLLFLKSQILSLSRQTSDILTYWLDQREQTMMDSETYNQMIECLVGQAQKLRDGGSNQGRENRGKRFMKNNSVASGLASISLSFKNKKAQSSSPNSPKSEVTVNNKTTSRNNIGIQERPLSMY